MLTVRTSENTVRARARIHLQSFPKSFPIQCATSVTCPGAFRLAEVVSSMSEGRILSWNVLSYQEKYATTALFPLA